ncbi:MAG TPA: FAD-dependent monooxygenase [Streptosporangiaceae bacterium]|jgi:2-polyprenyl-6-methoxyphenol hydroxylase-like FAD-dependent oxidoreductase
MYDVIIVGARAAGAATAMLLARDGLRVLAVDRAEFPSDTLSTHQVQLPGVAKLARWGLLDKVVASGAPPTREVRFDTGAAVVNGRFPPFEGVDALYSPRRTILDALLVDAARAAGAEVRERFQVEEIAVADGRITGRAKGGRMVAERARLIVGADGKHSLVARAAAAPAYHERSPQTVASYTYWAGVPLDRGEIYAGERRAVGAWPTNDGLVMTYVAWPAEEFGAFRADVEGNLLATLDLAGELGERIRSGERAERIRTIPDLPARFRRPFGPGWALVGDAGLVLDPITGQGIGHAFRDAELLSAAVVEGLGGGRPLETTLAEYTRKRDEDSLPMYEFTAQLAALAPPKPQERALFAALAAKPAEADRFLGVIAGSVPIPSYLAPANLFRVIGPRGMAKLALSRLRAAR